MRVLDVGTGNGRYARAITEAGGSAIALDLSLGMLREVNRSWARVTADAETLPFASASIDGIIAAHMLYHLAHPQRALAQFARVLATDGVLVATTNTEIHLAEMRHLWEELLHDQGLDPIDPNLALMNLELPIDRLLADAHAVFGHVESRLLTSSLRCDDPSVVIGYVASTTAAMATSELGYDLLTPFGDRVRTLIEHDGAFEVTTQVMLVRCGRPRLL
jgi:SAM-dependent methyltransferase